MLEAAAVTIGGSLFKPGRMFRQIADNDRIASRPMLDQEFSIDTSIVVLPDADFVMTMDTDNGVNDVEVEITIAFSGDGKVYDDDDDD